jgi:hypothetical protein
MTRTELNSRAKLQTNLPALSPSKRGKDVVRIVTLDPAGPEDIGFTLSVDILFLENITL